MNYVKDYPSGLRLICNKMEGCYSVSFGVFVDVGSIRESSAENGFSHFIEHLLFKGTKKRTSLQISEEFDNIGASVNAFTAKDYTCFYSKSISADLERCMDVISDMYFNPAFSEKEMDLERRVVLEEIKMYNDMPDDLVSVLCQQAAYPNQSWGQTILGNPQNIKYCDRHSISEFKNKHYIPSATVISVAGALDFAEVDALVQKYFECNYSVSSQLPGAPQPTHESTFLHEFKEVKQSHLELCWPAYAMTDDDSYAAGVVSDVLGGGMTSRLFQELREKRGLVYSVHSVASSYKHCGLFGIYLGYGPKNNELVVELIQAEIAKLLKDGITKQELERSTRLSVNSCLIAGESNMSVMRVNGKRLLKTMKGFDIEAEIEKYKSVTIDDVNRVAQTIFANAPAAAYVGPQSDNFDAAARIFNIPKKD